jgi:23S rRNA (uracil1939-C5)-methyltransferase
MKLKIEKISNLGVGIAYGEDVGKKSNKIFVPKTIIGDEVEAEILRKTNKFTSAKLTKIIKESPDRKEAECEYFAKCGGCSLQHYKDNFYLDFKKKAIAETITRSELGFEGEVKFIEVGKESRRRVSFHVDDKNNLGFYEEGSHDLVNIEHCLMLEKDLDALIPDLQKLLKELPINTANLISICKFDNVLDVVFELKEEKISLDVTTKLAQFAVNKGNINLSSKFGKNISPIFQKSKPQLNFESLKIDVPNGIFLQATSKGQEAITAQILEFVNENKPKIVADIFCGIGTYSFAIIDKIDKISAYEGNDRMVSAVNHNARKNNVNHKISAAGRDLSSNPVREEELKGCDLVIINPPRTGARTQSLKLAHSEVKNIIMVSCDLNTFANDSRSLLEGGFKIDKLVAIDQFYYTAHTEIVATFKKD